MTCQRRDPDPPWELDRQFHGSLDRPQLQAYFPLIRELDIPVKTSAVAAVAIRTALTDRELEIFKRLASGKSNHEIARDLSLSPNTVANHVAGILSKLHLENRIQAAVEAVRSGIS